MDHPPGPFALFLDHYGDTGRNRSFHIVYETCPISTRVNTDQNDGPHILALGRSWRSFGRGRKSELTAEIDDYSIVGEIGIKMTSTIRTLANHALTPARY